VAGLVVERLTKGGSEALAVAIDGLTAREIRDRLLAGDPAVATVVIADRLLIQSTECLRDGDLELLVRGFARIVACSQPAAAGATISST
jgi:hypothetical protein